MSNPSSSGLATASVVLQVVKKKQQRDCKGDYIEGNTQNTTRFIGHSIKLCRMNARDEMGLI